MTAHSEREHALLSPSAAHRWLNCTPSAILEAELPDTTSEAAKEGTIAHELAEGKLRRYFFPDDYSRQKLTALKKKLKKDPLWQDEMEHYTDEYLDFVKAEAMRFEKEPYIMIEKELDLSAYIPDGFGTADCIMVGYHTIEVIDFKYGKGVPVSAENNPQMKIYAHGACCAYYTLCDVHNVRMAICQPRIDNNSAWDMSAEALARWATNELMPRAQDAYHWRGELKPGDWCKFCRVRATCKARADENIRLAFEPAFKEPPAKLTNEEVGKFLKMGEDIQSWISDLKEYALSECLAGREVAGWKAVEGRGPRDWTDQENAFGTLQRVYGIEEAMLYERKPLSVAKVEKLMGKKDFIKMSDYVDKKPGKPTLVEESDKREAITLQTSAAEAFKE